MIHGFTELQRTFHDSHVIEKLPRVPQLRLRLVADSKDETQKVGVSFWKTAQLVQMIHNLWMLLISFHTSNFEHLTTIVFMSRGIPGS